MFYGVIQFYFFPRVWFPVASSNYTDILTSLFLGGLLCVTSATKQEEVKRLPGGKIKKKVSALQIFLPFDVYEQALLHETNNGVFVVGKHWVQYDWNYCWISL